MTRPVGDAVLTARDVSVRFGAVQAVDRVSIEVGSGQIVGLIGANGAGKTTLVDALTGFVATTGGDVVFRGEPIGALPAAERARRGMARTFQTLELFEDLSVVDNALVAAERPGLLGLLASLVGVRASKDGVRQAMEAVARVGLAERRDVVVSELSHGERKLVAIARALALRPSLLLLDEPAAGLDTTETAALARQIESLRSADLSVLMVEHDMAMIMGVCDTVFVLDQGRLLARGTPAEIQDSPEVVAAYLGTDARRPGPAETG